MKNLDIINMKEDLINVVNKYNTTPILVKQMVLGEVQGILSSVAGAEIERERQALEREGEEDEQSI